MHESIGVDPLELNPLEFYNLRSEIRKLCGLVIEDEKQYLVRQRLGPIVRSNGWTSFGQLCAQLSANKAAKLREEVIAAITTNETSFFRDAYPFVTFREYILPRLGTSIQSHKSHTWERRGAKATILCAGASTGQEPFSLSIEIHEFVGRNPSYGLAPQDFAITAIDISSEALAAAMAGRYSRLEINRGLPDGVIAEHFTRDGDYWQVNADIHELVTFRMLNLTEPIVSLGSFDVIFCRNVLIYFDHDTKRQILSQFHRMLTKDGILILGASENLIGLNELFNSARHDHTVYYEPIRAGN